MYIKQLGNVIITFSIPSSPIILRYSNDRFQDWTRFSIGIGKISKLGEITLFYSRRTSLYGEQVLKVHFGTKDYLN